MTRGQNTARRLFSWSAQSNNICSTCLRQLRVASTAAAPVETAPIEPSPSGKAPPPFTAPQSHSTRYNIKASVLLSRPPLLTRDLTPFEKSYFLYQRRLNERLALPFTRYFYYPEKTPADVEWKRKIKERQTPARDIGVYNAYSREDGWNDELLVGDRLSEPDEQIERLIKDAEVEVKERDVQGEGEVIKREEIERPMPRITEADEKGDFTSLNRRLQSTLYLVVKQEEGPWSLPSSILEKECLHTAAERIIVQTGGVNMNTWVVGNMPIGHQVYTFSQAIVDKDSGSETRGEKVFYMKARIMAGQANLKDNRFGLAGYQWLAKDEIQTSFLPRDWNAVKNILPER